MAKMRWAAIAGVLALGTGTAVAALSPEPAPQRTALAGAATPWDPAQLQADADAVHKAGMPGLFAEVRDGDRVWRGAAGVADVRTGRKVTPGMRHRVGSITKTFTAAAILQQVQRGEIRLDAPIGRYLPELVPGERGQKITVRMLLNHTSHIGDYIGPLFGTVENIDANRFKRHRPDDLIAMGLQAPATGRPGVQPGSYSNTNFVILGRLLEKSTGTKAERYITRNVIAKAGLRHTSFPASPRIKGPHPRMYESMYGMIDPPRDYSVYDPTWVNTAGALVSTMPDLNRFYSALLDGKIINRKSLAQMRRTVKVTVGGGQIDYGLGLYSLSLPCGKFWGHDGAVWGAGAQTLVSQDGSRRVSFGQNLMKWNELDSEGRPLPHPIDNALGTFLLGAACGTTATPKADGPVQPYSPLITSPRAR